MVRQTGFALGIAVLVTVLGTSAAHPGGPVLRVFRAGSWVTAGISFPGIVPALALVRRATPARTTA
jgi:hypothetical protein